MLSMWYAVGLGNPGKEYEVSRHNAGWMAVELLRQKLDLPKFKSHPKFSCNLSRSSEVTLVQPTTYMNESGTAVRSLLHYYESPSSIQELMAQQLFVFHDDLDLELGSYKLQLGKGPKVHNGLLSLYTHLGTEQFWHVRIGVDTRGGDRTIPAANFVLQPFSQTESGVFYTVVAQCIDDVISHVSSSAPERDSSLHTL